MGYVELRIKSLNNAGQESTKKSMFFAPSPSTWPPTQQGLGTFQSALKHGIVIKNVAKSSKDSEYNEEKSSFYMQNSFLILHRTFKFH